MRQEDHADNVEKVSYESHRVDILFCDCCLVLVEAV
jgi:hypothetical protein